MLPTTAPSLTPIVLQTMAQTPDPRLRELLMALVRHLHAFVQETRLSESEFEQALAIVNRIGQTSNDSHNEAVLMADVLGLSSYVALQANADPQGVSDAALLGPFWRANAPRLAPGSNIAAAGTPGLVLEVRGSVRDIHHRPVAGATVDVWQASPKGMYENQDPDQPEMNLRGRFETDAQGGFFLRSVRPAGYPLPTHGPGGDLLRAQGRHPNRPAHLHFMVSKPGFKVLITQVFAGDDANLHSDPVFGVTERLVGRFENVQRDGQMLATLHQQLTLLEGEMVFPHPPIA